MSDEDFNSQVINSSSETDCVKLFTRDKTVRLK